MKKKLLVRVLQILLLAGMVSEARAVSVFSQFSWGESMESVKVVLKDNHGKIVETKTLGNRQCLVVEGLAAAPMLRTLFYFREGTLDEIERQYGDDSWDSARFMTFFERLKQNMETQKYGIGKRLSNNKKVDEGISHTLLAYQWPLVPSVVTLCYFAAEKGDDTYRLVSLHQRRR